MTIHVLYDDTYPYPESTQPSDYLSDARKEAYDTIMEHLNALLHTANDYSYIYTQITIDGDTPRYLLTDSLYDIEEQLFNYGGHILTITDNNGHLFLNNEIQCAEIRTINNNANTLPLVTMNPSDIWKKHTNIPHAYTKLTQTPSQSPTIEPQPTLSEASKAAREAASALAGDQHNNDNLQNR